MATEKTFYLNTIIDDSRLSKPEGYILMATNSTTLTNCLDELQHLSNWNAKAIFLIIDLGLSDVERDEVIRFLWKILTIRFFMLDSVDLITASPFHSCNITNVDVVYDTIRNCAIDFQFDIISQLPLCDYTIVLVPKVYETSSILMQVYMEILWSICERENVTVKLHPKNARFLRTRGGSSLIPPLMLQDMDNEPIINALHGTFIGLDMDKFSLFDVHYYMQPANWIWIVPKAQPMEQWKSIVLVFDFTGWMWIFAVFLLMIVSQGGIDFLIDRSATDVPKYILNALAITLNVPIPFIAKTTTITIRFLIAIWFLYGLHVTTAFQGNLLSILTNPIYEKQIKTEGEIIERNLTVYTFKAVSIRFAEFFTNYPNHRSFIPIFNEDWEASLVRIAITNEMLDLDRRLINRKRYFLERTFATAYSAIYTKRGHPIELIFGKWLLRFHNSGLPLRAFDEIARQYRREMRRYIQPEVLVALSNKHLGIAYRILIFGKILSCVVFLIEFFKD